ncbi:NAD(P)/FAD-dependent oxidoreductase [Kineosporia sp. J2-2]|uniref:NAD(P)/FAD-dependent oxidoreductase n=1 Tax=Kineosporia corallincola TaxID=2835133 RepID=A0ABS5TS29_9ACTN|nr:NAD(P)/FAD-dependent oxidoreductase [Kineosporia corallincola]MBT0773611.1 NAD(P)/FAD-dependent oxidoreductase [Kineosporia corallincola]
MNSNTDRLRTGEAEQLDVLIIGAGLSGIATACHLERSLPHTRYAVLEARPDTGGTWDLFRYPGVRSDSDMFTLGYSFRPWRGRSAVADGGSVLNYLRETAEEYGVSSRIRLGHRVFSASWSGERARWLVRVRLEDDEELVISCGFLCLNTGYYDYEQPHLPEFPGRERFTGRLVHPQLWPDDLSWAGQDVVVIGSGATAVSMVPALAPAARRVIMLQRSPGYLISLPARIPWTGRRPKLERLRSATVTSLFWHLCRLAPRSSARWLIGRVRRLLPPGYPVHEHFTPRYRPWDQRLCLVPDADLFTALASGDAEVVTGTVDTLTERGVRLTDGRELPATLIVAATGLRLKLLGGIALDLDGEPVDPGSTVMYKGSMLSGVPNLSVTVGYPNASWTLKAELTARFVVRVLRHRRRCGYRVAVASPPPSPQRLPLMPLTSGYLLRSARSVPRQGGRWPWRLYHSFWIDTVLVRGGRVNGEGLTFRR